MEYNEYMFILCGWWKGSNSSWRMGELPSTKNHLVGLQDWDLLLPKVPGLSSTSAPTKPLIFALSIDKEPIQKRIVRKRRRFMLGNSIEHLVRRGDHHSVWRNLSNQRFNVEVYLNCYVFCVKRKKSKYKRSACFKSWKFTTAWQKETSALRNRQNMVKLADPNNWTLKFNSEKCWKFRTTVPNLWCLKLLLLIIYTDSPILQLMSGGSGDPDLHGHLPLQSGRLQQWVPRLPKNATKDREPYLHQEWLWWAWRVWSWNTKLKGGQIQFRSLWVAIPAIVFHQAGFLLKGHLEQDSLN